MCFLWRDPVTFNICIERKYWTNQFQRRYKHRYRDATGDGQNLRVYYRRKNDNIVTENDNIVDKKVEELLSISTSEC